MAKTQAAGYRGDGDGEETSTLVGNGKVGFTVVGRVTNSRKGMHRECDRAQ